MEHVRSCAPCAGVQVLLGLAARGFPGCVVATQTAYELLSSATRWLPWMRWAPLGLCGLEAWQGCRGEHEAPWLHVHA